MSEDAVLKKNNIIPPGVPGSSPREMAVIFKLASQLKPEVSSSHIHNSTRKFNDKFRWRLSLLLTTTSLRG